MAPKLPELVLALLDVVPEGFDCFDGAAFKDGCSEGLEGVSATAELEMASDEGGLEDDVVSTLSPGLDTSELEVATGETTSSILGTPVSFSQSVATVLS